MKKVKYISKLDKVAELNPDETKELEPVVDKYAFRTNDYYNSLIDWSDPDDPLRRLVIPQKEELLNWGELDASNETLYQPVHGLEHKYQETALLLCNDVCAAYCRFCFRKRLFQNDNDEVVKLPTKGINYIREHPEINNVLLTGGDPLVMSTRRISEILEELCKIDHIKNIRIGTKVPAFNPFRITQDQALLDMIETYSSKKQIYIMAHFNHIRELTDEAVKSLKLLRKAGAAIVNQTPIIKGVNDSVEVLTDLFAELSFIGIQPYYVFACRPTAGNKSFSVPIEEAYELFELARKQNSGLAKTARFTMSHKNGKFEVLGLTHKYILIKKHNVVKYTENTEIVIYKRNRKAFWLDDYELSGNLELESINEQFFQ